MNSNWCFYLIMVMLMSFAARSQTVTVRVTDYHGDPVANAEVTAYEKRLHLLTEEEQPHALCEPLTTNQHGQVQLALDCKQARLVMIAARKSGYALGWDVLPSYGDAEPVVHIVLDKPVVLAGRVEDKDGQPVSDAVVWAHPKISKLNRLEQTPVIGPADWLMTRTDSAGRFTFTCFGHDVRADFLVTIPGLAITHTFTPHYLASCGYEAGRENVRLVLPETVAVRGRVVDDKGRAIDGMHVVIGPHQSKREFQNDYEPLLQQTDSDGRFVFEAVPVGRHYVTVRNTDLMKPWVDQMVRVDVTDGAADQHFRICLETGGIAEVTMQEQASGSPIEAMYLIFSQPPADANDCWFSRMAETDSDGNVHVMLPTGQCSVRFWDERPFEREALQLPEIEAGRTHPVTFSLIQQKPITGKVVDPSGDPVENCSVKMTWGQRVMTDAAGEFVCAYERLREGMCLIARDADKNRAAVVPVGDPDAPVSLTLKPACTLTGRVVDPNGEPIPAARVSISFSGPCCPEVLTDRDGRFEVKAIPSEMPDGFAFRISVTTMNHGALTYERLQIQNKADAVIELKPTVMSPADQTVNGSVNDTDGTPAAGLPIFLQGDGQYHHSTVTDEAGRFELRRVCSGTIRLQAGIGGEDFKPGFIEAEGGDTDLKMILGQDRVHVPEVSLLGKALPQWPRLSDGKLPQTLNDTALLVCFWDFSQRPSRHLLGQLVQMKPRLANKQVELVLIQTRPADDAVKKWLDERPLTGYTIDIIDDVDAVRQAWGVKALPWLILSDAGHTVIAEGFAVDELDEKLKAL